MDLNPGSIFPLFQHWQPYRAFLDILKKLWMNIMNIQNVHNILDGYRPWDKEQSITFLDWCRSFTWCGHTRRLVSLHFRLLRPWRPFRSCAIFKEAHLVSSHNVQFSFKFIDGVIRDVGQSLLMKLQPQCWSCRTNNARPTHFQPGYWRSAWAIWQVFYINWVGLIYFYTLSYGWSFQCYIGFIACFQDLCCWLQIIREYNSQIFFVSNIHQDSGYPSNSCNLGPMCMTLHFSMLNFICDSCHHWNSLVIDHPEVSHCLLCLRSC